MAKEKSGHFKSWAPDSCLSHEKWNTITLGVFLFTGNGQTSGLSDLRTVTTFHFMSVLMKNEWLAYDPFITPYWSFFLYGILCAADIKTIFYFITMGLYCFVTDPADGHNFSHTVALCILSTWLFFHVV